MTSYLSSEARALLTTLLEQANCDGPWENPAIRVHGEQAFIELSALCGYEYMTRFDEWRGTRSYPGTGIWQYAGPRDDKEFTIVLNSSSGLFYAMNPHGEIIWPSLAECERELWDLVVKKEMEDFYG